MSECDYPGPYRLGAKLVRTRSGVVSWYDGCEAGDGERPGHWAGTAHSLALGVRLCAALNGERSRLYRVELPPLGIGHRQGVIYTAFAVAANVEEAMAFVRAHLGDEARFTVDFENSKVEEVDGVALVATWA